MGYRRAGDWIAVGHQLEAGTGLTGEWQGFFTEDDPPSMDPPGAGKMHIIGSIPIEPLKKWVKEGRILAAVRNEIVDDNDFTVFSTQAITPRAFLMPAGSKWDDLAKAINAGIKEFIIAGNHTDLTDELGIGGEQVLSCTPENKLYEYPENRSGVLQGILDNKKLKIAQLGTENEDGNIVAPDWGNSGSSWGMDDPKGLWPRVTKQVVDNIARHYNKSIEVKNNFYLSSQKVLENVFNQTDDISGPYYSLAGAWENPNTNEREAREMHFRESCIVHGYEPHAFVQAQSDDNMGISKGALAGIIVAGVVAVASVIVIAIMARRERSGRPLFKPLNDDNGSSPRASQYSKASPGGARA